MGRKGVWILWCGDNFRNAVTTISKLFPSFSFLVSQAWSVEVEEDEDRVHYDGYQVIRALPHTQDQLDTLHTIGQSNESAN